MTKKTIKEFDFISQYLTPLTSGFKGALQLQDDIAIFPKDAKTDYVITLDSIAENVHFLKSASAKQIANKLLRTNLSDIASCGASPKFYMMTGSLMPQNWLKEFTDEIAKIQKEFGIFLIGGDTIKTKQKFFSVTMIGEIAKGKAILRNGAQIGDDIYLSGKIGEAWLGLQILKKNKKILDIIPKNKYQYYINKHYAPTPQILLGKKLLGLANSCTDISDGLLKDLSNICKTSSVSAEINLERIPLAIKNYAKEQITAGDDYQLVFTAKEIHENKINKLNCIKIGKIVAKNKNHEIILLDKNLNQIKTKRLGYEH
jgi:thiamine-monophosphate kinase